MIKKTVIALTLLCSFIASAYAQKATVFTDRKTKMSSWLYDQYQQQQTALRNNGTLLRSQKQPVRKYVLALVESTDGDATIRQKGGVVLQDFWDGISAAFLPVDSLGVLDRSEHILRMEANEPARIMNDTSAIITGADRAWTGQGALPQAFTGKGVYAGVMDVGFDFTHPAFRNEDGTSRIQWFWDPMAPDGSSDDLGMIYTSPEMVLAARHTTDADKEIHGTHCLGTLAGNGLNGTYVGMAPEADIIGSYIPLTGNKTVDYDYLNKRLTEYLKKHLPGLENFSDETFEMIGSATWHIVLLYRIFKQADTKGKPCVISWSFGGILSLESCYDSSLFLYMKLLNQMLGSGHILVASAGNSGGSETYVRMEADSDKKQDIYYGYQKSGLIYSFITRTIIDTTSFNMYLTFKDFPDTVNFDLTKIVNDTTNHFNSEKITRPSADDSDSIVLCTEIDQFLGDTVIITTEVSFSQSYYDSISHKYSCPFGTVMFETPHLVEIADYYSGITFSKHTPYNSQGYHLGTVLFPGGYNDRIICVGAILHRKSYINSEGEKQITPFGIHEGRLASFSSCGPSMTGHIKPDVVAPGVNIISALNSYYSNSADIVYEAEAFGRKYSMIPMNGTSMATPMVAGIIALWLQAKPDLTPEEILGVLERTSHQPEPEFSGTEKNNYYGYGEIDAYAGLLDILGLSTSVPALSQHQPAGITFSLEGRTLCINGIETDTQITVYNLDGTPVLSTTNSDGIIELPDLATGVYAVQIGKKGSTLIRLY